MHGLEDKVEGKHAWKKQKEKRKGYRNESSGSGLKGCPNPQTTAYIITHNTPL